MSNLFTDVNAISVLVAAVASMVVGFVWYSNVLFGKPWMKLSGIDPKKMAKKNKSMGVMYAFSLALAVLMAFVLALFKNAFGALSVSDGVTVGFMAWVGFVAPTMMNNVIFGRDSFPLYAINAGYQLASLVTMGAILALF